MTKEVIGKSRFVDEINKRLTTYPEYAGGEVVMQVDPANPAKFFAWNGPADAQALLGRACGEVLNEFAYDPN